MVITYNIAIQNTMNEFLTCEYSEMNAVYRLCSVHTYDVHAQSTVVHVHSVFIVASIEKKS